MAYSLLTVRNRVLTDKLDDTSYSTSVIDNFINDAQREIFNLYQLPFMEKTFIGTLPAANFIYVFPTDYKIAQSLVISDPANNRRDITDNYVHFRDFNSAYPTPVNNTATTPRVWTSYGNQLYFSAPTDQVYTLTLFYLKNPVTLSAAGDVPELPQAFEEALILGAYYRALERNEDFDLAAVVEQKYRDQLDIIVANLSNRQVGTPNVMGQPLRARAGRRSRRRS